MEKMGWLVVKRCSCKLIAEAYIISNHLFKAYRKTWRNHPPTHSKIPRSPFLPPGSRACHKNSPSSRPTSSLYICLALLPSAFPTPRASSHALAASSRGARWECQEPKLFNQSQTVVGKEGEGFVKGICFGRDGGMIGPDEGGKEVAEIDGLVLKN